MKRFQHRLRVNHKSILPDYLVFVHILYDSMRVDQTNSELVLSVGYAEIYKTTRSGYLVHNSGFRFTDRQQFWHWFFSSIGNRGKYIVIGDDVGRFYRIISARTFLRRHGFKRTKMWIDKGIFVIHYKNNDVRIVFEDNHNVFRNSLILLADDVGLPINDSERDIVTYDQKLSRAKHIVHVLARAWESWMQFNIVHDTGNFSLTVSGQAFNAYRHRFMENEIFIHTNEKATKLERSSYFGGRVEPLWIGRYTAGRVWRCDINSHYPYVMAQELYPTRFLGFYAASASPSPKWFSQGFRWISTISVHTDLPIVPVRQGEKVIYPVGEFETTLAYPELALLDEYHIPYKIYEYALYSTDRIFDHYVDYFYRYKTKYKVDGNKSFTALTKLFLNGLYGKFGQTLNEWLPYDDPGFGRDGIYEEWDIEKQDWNTIRVFEGKSEIKGPASEGFNSFPAISSFITSYARAYLWRLMHTAGSHNVLYVDTDSLFLTDKGKENLEGYFDEQQLGKLKIEDVSDDIEIRGSKDYTFNHVDVIKGIRKDADYLSPGLYRQNMFESFKGALRRGSIDNAMVRSTQKHISSIYDKARVTPEGWTEPWDFAELPQGL